MDPTASNLLHLQPDLERNAHLIVIPNEKDKISFYLNTWMSDFASRLLHMMEDWVLSLSLPPPICLCFVGYLASLSLL